MSAVDSVRSSNVVKRHMLRTRTPGPEEKVMVYLQRMNEDRPAPEDNEMATLLLSPKPRSATSSRRLEDMAGGRGGSYVDQEIRSDVQEGHGSDVARTIPIQTTGLPDHEPGPNDPPGPHFPSHGSWGNLGPLPDSKAGTEISSKAAGVPLPETVPPASPTDSHPNPFQSYGMTPANPAGIPLPPSVLSGQNPKSRTGAASKLSNKPLSNVDAHSNAGPARALSPNRTGNAEPVAERSLSPRSAASRGQSTKSRATQKTNRTNYPPLPESALDEPPMSPPPRTHNKSPSIGPSESASQVKPRRQPQPSSHYPSKSLKSIMEVNGESGESRGGSKASTSHRDAVPMSPRSQPSHIPQHRTGATSNDAGFPSGKSRRSNLSSEVTPRPGPADDELSVNSEEERLIKSVVSHNVIRKSLALSTAPSMLELDIQNSGYHDEVLCELFHALGKADYGEQVKKAVRKGIRSRVKKLGMRYDNKTIEELRQSFHEHGHSTHGSHMEPQSMPSPSKYPAQLGSPSDPPDWARDLIDGMVNMRERLDNLAPKIERSLRTPRGAASRSEPYATESRGYTESEVNGGYARSVVTQTTQMLANQRTGTMADESMFQPDIEPPQDPVHLHNYPGSTHHQDSSLQDGIIPEEDEPYGDEEHLHPVVTDDGYEFNDREESTGNQYLQQEIYKLQAKPYAGSQSKTPTHRTWELTRGDGDDYTDDGDGQAATTDLPDMADRSSPPLPPLPHGDIPRLPEPGIYPPGEYGNDHGPPPWQRVHQRLLSWAIVWPMAELDKALNSTTRGMQVDEIALSIWSTQTYKRYVRAKMTDNPPGRVDRLFVPPNMADAISTAVYNGRHGDASGLLRDLWAPFGLEGIPRLLIVLAKHRTDENHWVVHRFSLPDGSLTTYDTYPERCLPDGRPLGWWFAIRIAWPDALYPSPDNLMQKMVRLHRPMQLAIDNSIAAAGIWRNLLMGSRAERSLDLERLRDLINTEVKNLRQRKQMGKLSIGSARPTWEDMP